MRLYTSNVSLSRRCRLPTSRETPQDAVGAASHRRKILSHDLGRPYRPGGSPNRQNQSHMARANRHKLPLRTRPTTYPRRERPHNKSDNTLKHSGLQSHRTSISNYHRRSWLLKNRNRLRTRLSRARGARDPRLPQLVAGGAHNPGRTVADVDHQA
jgi:hypothetical protein